MQAAVRDDLLKNPPTPLLMHDRDDGFNQAVPLPNPSFQEVESDAKGIS